MSSERLLKKRVTVNDLSMAYVESGQGHPIWLQHGNPTSSYLWRNIIPHLSGLGRCIAPDLIGMGDSDKRPGDDPGRYRFVEHRAFIDAFMDQVLPDEPVILVLHDWGSALGFDWARRNPSRVRGIVYMEAIVKPLTWEEFPGAFRETFQALRGPEGDSMILDQNLFIEGILPNAILRDLTEEEMAVYRQPFSAPGEDRRPTLTWPRELPIAGEPADVIRLVEQYGDWLAASQVPKLFINADPGAIVTGEARSFCRSWPNQEEITVPGVHFVQEDAPDTIGEAIAQWIQRLNV
ncbi:haloalkane dehalogenase [Algiphilus sp.]|uniref:haloalkane dehalogenase n=1 Tax=Algiphilus sp. TaxID=1872431 RepID=UPI0025B9673B|nr:haloalkane dehalogenase [Algiphilus sp.]MCK5771159.1 haloalkane dehalogenase [Algiphilus sp.]